MRAPNRVLVEKVARAVGRKAEALAGRLYPIDATLASMAARPFRAASRADESRRLPRRGRLRGAAKALAMGPQAVIDEVTASGLVGRGGAAFPTGRKWAAVAGQPATPHYLVCNADESEPGTFKDRALLEEDPFAIVEAMTIAGIATGAERGYLYLRGEYPLARERLADAIDQAQRGRPPRPGRRGSGRAFDLELRIGAGAYIAGEETALFESIEGGRPEPRNKPPFPVEVGPVRQADDGQQRRDPRERAAAPADGRRGLHGASAPAAAPPARSCSASPGTSPARACTRRRSARRWARCSSSPAASRTAGASRPCSSAARRASSSARTRWTCRSPSRRRAPPARRSGSGVILAYDETADLADALRRIAAFFRDESCGQCVPCRVGTVRQEELLARLAAGRPLGSLDQELALFHDLAQGMRDASICGLGQTASSAIESALRTGLVRFDGAAGATA